MEGRSMALKEFMRKQKLPDRADCAGIQLKLPAATRRLREPKLSDAAVILALWQESLCAQLPGASARKPIPSATAAEVPPGRFWA